MPRTKEEQLELAHIVAEVLKQNCATDSGIHEDEHRWLRERIEKEKERADFYRKTGQAVFGTVLAAFLLWLGSKGIAFAQFILSSGK